MHPATYSSEWDTPLLTLNLVNASNDAVLASFRALTFNNLVSCQNTDIDSSLIIRMNVQSYRGGQIYSKVDLMAMKQPFITEIYNFDINMALMKNRGMIVYEEPSENYIIPEEYSLFQNYPNPFNAQTTIKYAVPTQAKVQIYIFNIKGEKVCTLVDEKKRAGYYEIHWNGNSLSSGIYFIQMNAGQFSEIKKMTVVK